MANTILITGAAQRIGRELAIFFAAKHWNVAIHYNTSRAEATTLCNELRELGVKSEIFAADLNDETQVKSLFTQASQYFGQIDVLVNNASRFVYDDAKTIDYSSLIDHIKPNLAAPLLLSQMLYEHLKVLDKQGLVVNILDQKLFNPNPDYLSYTLTRVALQSATVMLAQTLAPTLRVVGVAPGLTLPSGKQTVEEFSKAHQQTVLGQSSNPIDIAEAIYFLAHATKITGTTIPVDGGQHLVPLARDIQFV